MEKKSKKTNSFRWRKSAYNYTTINKVGKTNKFKARLNTLNTSVTDNVDILFVLDVGDQTISSILQLHKLIYFQ
jgi:hypothetical protein